MMKPLLFCLLLTSVIICSCKKREEIAPPTDGKLTGTVLFLGDGLTREGGFISYLDAVLAAKGVAPSPELINLGIPKENCTGLSEPDPKFPRPNINDRLDRTLEIVRPDTVFVCYGMTDGIFSPFSEERFAAFQNGINAIIEKVHAANAKLVLITPPPFDPENLRAKDQLRHSDADNFSFSNIYENYDTEVLEKYSDWIIQQSSRVEGIVNLRPPLLSYLEEKRQKDPDFTFRVNGLRIDTAGHKVLAKTILSALGEDTKELDSLKWRYFERSEKRQEILQSAWLTHLGLTIPNEPPGLPLEDARKAADLVELIQRTKKREKGSAREKGSSSILREK